MSKMTFEEFIAFEYSRGNVFFDNATAEEAYKVYVEGLEPLKVHGLMVTCNACDALILLSEKAAYDADPRGYCIKCIEETEVQQ